MDFLSLDHHRWWRWYSITVPPRYTHEQELFCWEGRKGRSSCLEVGWVYQTLLQG